MSSLIAAAIAETVLVTYRLFKNPGGHNPYPIGSLPLPANYVGIVIVFGALALLNEAGSIRPVPAVAGWAFVLATLLNLWDPTTINKKGGAAVAKAPTPAKALAPLFSHKGGSVS